MKVIIKNSSLVFQEHYENPDLDINFYEATGSPTDSNNAVWLKASPDTTAVRQDGGVFYTSSAWTNTATSVTINSNYLMRVNDDCIVTVANKSRLTYLGKNDGQTMNYGINIDNMGKMDNLTQLLLDKSRSIGNVKKLILPKITRIRIVDTQIVCTLEDVTVFANANKSYRQNGDVVDIYYLSNKYFKVRFNGEAEPTITDLEIS